MNYIPERDLIKFLLIKEQYNSYFPFVDVQHIRDHYKELYHIYIALVEAHTLTDADITMPAIQAMFFQKYPDADRETYLALFKTIQDTEIDPALGLGMLKALKARKTAMSLSEAAFKFSTGSAQLEDVQTAFANFANSEQTDIVSDEFVSDDLEYLLNSTVQTPGLRWRLDFLNKSMGSLRKGDFGFLFARPETGKTTFLASEISKMLEQLKDEDGPIIWFNNEEQSNKVMLRVYQAYFGVRLDQLMANIPRFAREFKERVKGKLKIVDAVGSTRQEIERMLKALNPSLVVFDQITKVKGFQADREDLKMGAICIWAREMAKTYCPVIGVMQADGSAEGQKWLTMDNVANVKTAVQAEADWILGIGKTHAEDAQQIRYLQLSKNKLAGDPDTIEHLRHGRSEVFIEPTIARYQDIVKYE